MWTTKTNDMLLSNYGESLSDPVGFWKLLGLRIRKRVQTEVLHQEMVTFLYYLLEEEYSLKPEDPRYDEALFQVTRYIIRLYSNSNCPYHNMVELMNEEKQLYNRALFIVRDNKLYILMNSLNVV